MEERLWWTVFGKSLLVLLCWCKSILSLGEVQQAVTGEAQPRNTSPFVVPGLTWSSNVLHQSSWRLQCPKIEAWRKCQNSWNAPSLHPATSSNHLTDRFLDGLLRFVTKLDFSALDSSLDVASCSILSFFAIKWRLTTLHLLSVFLLPAASVLARRLHKFSSLFSNCDEIPGILSIFSGFITNSSTFGIKFLLGSVFDNRERCWSCCKRTRVFELSENSHDRRRMWRLPDDSALGLGIDPTTGRSFVSLHERWNCSDVTHRHRLPGFCNTIHC